jgi:hypothetical protein
MGGDMRLAEPFGKLPGDALGHAPRVDEHQSGAMRLRQFGDPVVDLSPDFRRHDRLQRRRRDFQGDVAGAAVTGVDDLTIRRSRGAGPDQEARHRLDRLLGR